MKASNRLGHELQKVERLPKFMQATARNFAIRRAVPFTGTAQIRYEVMQQDRVEVSVANKRVVQNHLGTVHAMAIGLLAETASGMIVGMNIRDDSMPLIKSLTLRFKRRVSGDMRAVASLSAEAQALMQGSTKGECLVPVTITDGTGESPIECDMLWAWTAKPAKK
jgi:acyl-coenzyme A thioesterase PaaI-like protein